MDNKNVFRIVRELKAPLTLVFRAYALKSEFEKWWGPQGASISVTHFDFRPGGSTLYKLDGNGMVMWGKFRYLTINEPTQIEFISSFSDESGAVCPSPFPMDFPLEIFNRISLSESNGITTLTLEGYPVGATQGQEETYKGLFESMNAGFAGTFKQLELLLEQSLSQ